MINAICTLDLRKPTLPWRSETRPPCPGSPARSWSCSPKDFYIDGLQRWRDIYQSSAPPSECDEYSNIFKYSNIYYQIMDIRI